MLNPGVGRVRDYDIGIWLERQAKRRGSSPFFELLGLDGQVHTSDEYQGKAMVINFWGTWCEPCVKEMPALQAQADKWKDKGVQFVGINVGEDQMTVENFVQQVGVDFPIMLDRDKNSVRDFGISPMPTTFLYLKRAKSPLFTSDNWTWAHLTLKFHNWRSSPDRRSIRVPKYEM